MGLGFRVFGPAHEDELWDSIGLGLLLPFRLRYGPGMLSKVIKPVMAFLRVTWGILIAIYMDDILIQGSSPNQVYLHAQVTALLFMILGWSLSWKKSDFIPKQ